MEAALRIVGDGLSIAALAIISSAALGAWKRVPKDVAVPMLWGGDGHPTLRVPRAVGLLAIPVLAMMMIFAFTLSGLTFTATGLDAIMLLCVRASLAALMALAQLSHLRFALKTLQDEGRL
jgi:uncharacterized membrane protein